MSYPIYTKRLKRRKARWAVFKLDKLVAIPKRKSLKLLEKKDFVKKILYLKRISYLNKNKKSLYLHSKINWIFYKAFELFIHISLDDKNRYDIELYDKDFFKRYRRRFILWLKRFILIYTLDIDRKKEMFQNRGSIFGFHANKDYTRYSYLASYYEDLFLKANYSKIDMTRHLQGAWADTLETQYHSMRLNSLYTFMNPYTYKWGMFTSNAFNRASYNRFKDQIRYSYFFFNISLSRFLLKKKYLNFFISFLVKKKTSLKQETYFCLMRDMLYQILGDMNKLYLMLSNTKHHLNMIFNKKSKLVHKNKDKHINFALKKCRLDDVRQLYLDILKAIYIKVFKINIHMKFSKSNVFITLTNFIGNVFFRNSIGLIGYKKDKKKTYYSAKQLIKKTFPNLLSFFSVRKLGVKSTIRHVSSDLFMLYLKLLVLKSNTKVDDLWDYKTEDKYDIIAGLGKVIASSMEKYMTLRIIVRGYKGKMKGLIKHFFRSFRFYKKKRLNQLSKILFIILNTKPHNGCKSPKKGRRKQKRRRQKMKIKLFKKKDEIMQRKLYGLFKSRRWLAKAYKVHTPEYLKKSTVKFNKFYTTKTEFLYGNMPTNISSSRENNFLYPGEPRTKEPPPFKKAERRRVTRLEKEEAQEQLYPLKFLPDKDERFKLPPKKISRDPRFYNLRLKYKN